MILRIFAWYLRSTNPKFSIAILKRDFEKLKAIIFKNRSRLFTGKHRNLKYLFGLQVTQKLIVTKLGYIFGVSNYNVYTKNCD